MFAVNFGKKTILGLGNGCFPTLKPFFLIPKSLSVPMFFVGRERLGWQQYGCVWKWCVPYTSKWLFWTNDEQHLYINISCDAHGAHGPISQILSQEAPSGFVHVVHTKGVANRPGVTKIERPTGTGGKLPPWHTHFVRELLPFTRFFLVLSRSRANSLCPELLRLQSLVADVFAKWIKAGETTPVGFQFFFSPKQT